MPRNPSDPRAIIDELLGQMGGRSFANLADAQRQLEARMRAYNEQPQQELGGLSPSHMYQLLNGDWATTGALIVNDALDLTDVGDPETLHNARVLLTTLRDEGPAKVTAGGNLSREFVGRMLPRLRWPRNYLEDVRRVNKVIDERDVPLLETLRYLLQFANLIHRRKGLHISPAGRAMLDDARRGKLLVLLFLTFFRKLDLRTIDGLGIDAGLQQTVAFSFWKIRSEAEEWTTPAHLADVAWLESAKDPTPPGFPEGDSLSREWRFRHRVLEPLVGFGLLESRDVRSADKWERRIQVRRTSLFDRLLRFEFR
jgi:hypothetical protein